MQSRPATPRTLVAQHLGTAWSPAGQVAKVRASRSEGAARARPAMAMTETKMDCMVMVGVVVESFGKGEKKLVVGRVI